MKQDLQAFLNSCFRRARDTEKKSWYAFPATSYLFGRFRLDELLVDFLGPRRHSERGLDSLVVLAGEPELDVLVAVLRFQEAAKSRQPI